MPQKPLGPPAGTGSASAGSSLGDEEPGPLTMREGWVSMRALVSLKGPKAKL